MNSAFSPRPAADRIRIEIRRGNEPAIGFDLAPSDVGLEESATRSCDPAGIVAPNTRRRYFGLSPGAAGAISLMPSTVIVIDDGGSPSARSHPRATATRIAASSASLFAVPSFA
jgi:hypothetical protein